MNKTEWIESHKCCPNCGSKNVEITEVENSNMNPEEYHDELSMAKCECGWKGMRKNLVPTEQNSRNIKVELRTMDKDGQVYVSCWDMVGAMRAYQANVIALLKDEQQRNFTTALFEEIYKMVIAADYQHRVAKEKQAAEDDSEINKEKDND